MVGSCSVNKTLVLAHSLNAVKSRLPNWSNLRDKTVHVVIVNKSKELDSLKEDLYKRTDIEFIDLTIKHAWEITQTPTTAKVNRPKGLIKATLFDQRSYVGKDTDKSNYTNDYLFFVPLDTKGHYLGKQTSFFVSQFLTKFGHLGGMSYHARTTARLSSEGVPTVYDFYHQVLKEHIASSEKFRRTFFIKRSIQNSNNSLFRMLCETDEEFVKKYGLYTDTDELSSFFLNLAPTYHAPEAETIMKRKPIPVVIAAENMLKTSILLRYLDSNAVLHQLRYRDSEEDVSFLKNLFINALNKEMS
jgi:hypothetical protein